MNYHHFTIEERCCLREYYVKGKSYREIARLLGRNVNLFLLYNFFRFSQALLSLFLYVHKICCKQNKPTRICLFTLL